MAYKQNPGRSPFLKTGRDIPLNFLQDSPLKETNPDVIADLKAKYEKEYGIEPNSTAFEISESSHAAENTEIEKKDLLTDNPVDTDASGGRSYADAYANRDMAIYGDLNLADYTTEAKRQNVSEKAGEGWDAPKTKMLGSVAVENELDKMPITDDSHGNVTELTRREKRVKKAKDKISDITANALKHKSTLTANQQFKVRRLNEKAKRIAKRDEKKKKK